MGGFCDSPGDFLPGNQSKTPPQKFYFSRVKITAALDVKFATTFFLLLHQNTAPKQGASGFWGECII